MPLPCLQPSLKGPLNLKTFGVTEVSQCCVVSQCVAEISFPIGIFFVIHSVTQFIPIPIATPIAMCHNCHIYHWHVSMIIKCVIRGLLVSDFNKVRRGGQQVLSRPSADSFAVGQRQKVYVSLF
jgi:hypothetical protein